MQFALEHIGLAARDTPALKNWYARVLDASVVFDNGATPPAFLLALKGGSMLEIYPAAQSEVQVTENTTAGLRHLAVRVNSIEAAQARLSERGVEFRDPIKPAGGGGRVLFFADPEGNLLHLVERPAESPLNSSGD